MPTPFANEPFTDFSQPHHREMMEEAIATVEAQFGRDYPLIIGGKKITANDRIRSINPSLKDEVVGIAQRGTRKHALDAIDAAEKAFVSWRHEPVARRAEALFSMASRMRERKFELAAWLVFEIGKSWAEADGDVAEAIDFCEFYGREALRFSAPRACLPWPGETNELVHIPLGVGAIIPPWNFPLAILVGMTTAAVVAGNTVVLKPSSDTPVIASKFMEIVEASGLPDGVINLVSGPGSDVGETLITHPKIRFISFTGSREVGLHIVEEAGKPREGQIWIKRVVAEMGGKDAIIVDGEADLAAAIEGTATSAFGFQGQKCSACSRAIVDESVLDAFLEGLASRVAKITLGPVRDPVNWMGPVSGKGAFAKIREYIEIGKKEGRLLCGGEANDATGYFIQPTVFANIAPTARLAQEEIFGPVLAVIPAKHYDDAIRIFNNTDYGLTGGVYTKNRDKIARARRECFCGNLYLNRKITGALVGVQPFGGYNMSGTCSKAGGTDYLSQFMQGKAICEKVS